jgi:hypothetical protein
MDFFLRFCIEEGIFLASFLCISYFVTHLFRLYNWAFTFAIGISLYITFHGLDALIFFTGKTDYPEVFMYVETLKIFVFPAVFLGQGLSAVLFGVTEKIFIHLNIWDKMGYIKTICFTVGYIIPCALEYAVFGFLTQKLFLGVSKKINQEKLKKAISIIKIIMAVFAAISAAYFIYCIIDYKYW